MANQDPRVMSWTHDGKDTNGKDLVTADVKGFQLDVDGQPFVDVPVPYEGAKSYSIPLKDLNIDNAVHHLIDLRLVMKNGVTSVPSNVFDLAGLVVPTAPLALGVA